MMRVPVGGDSARQENKAHAVGTCLQKSRADHWVRMFCTAGHYCGTVAGTRQMEYAEPLDTC
jgi:hypothetical protein